MYPPPNGPSLAGFGLLGPKGLGNRSVRCLRDPVRPIMVYELILVPLGSVPFDVKGLHRIE